MGEIVLVTSGNGGVGKSTAAVNIGACLASLSKSVVLVDGDVSMRQLDVLLGLENRDVQGFNSSITKGFMWDIDNCHVNISGTGSLSGNSRFIGVQYEGVAELNIEWWLLAMNFDQSGTALVGVYYTEYGEPQFTVALAYQNMWGTNKKLYYYIDSNGKTGNKNGTL